MEPSTKVEPEGLERGRKAGAEKAVRPKRAEPAKQTEPPKGAETAGQKEEAEEKVDLPTLAQLEAELEWETGRKEHSRVLRSTLFILLVAAAAAIIVAVMLFPVLQIKGTSMSDTLHDGDVVVTMNTSDFAPGDVVAFYYNNTLLVKRVIALPGDWVDIDKDGNVSVNGTVLDEPYLKEKALGECNIALPYQVPDEKIFVMGDHRETSVDSRNTAVGCIGKERVVGRLLLRVWPLSGLGLVR